HAGAPAQAVGRPGQRLDGDVAVVVGELAQLVLDDGRLQAPLTLGGHLLPVAAAALAGARVGTRRDDAVGRRDEHLDGVGAKEPRVARTPGDAPADTFARTGVTHEDDAALVARDAVAAADAVGDGE